MRKLSKILAVALALCLLCGAVVMSVGATSDNFTVANASGWQTQYDDALVLPEGLSVPADANGLTTTVRHGYDFEDRDSGLGISFLSNKISAHGTVWGMVVSGTNRQLNYDGVKTVSVGGAAVNKYWCWQPHMANAGFPETPTDTGYTAALSNDLYISEYFNPKNFDIEGAKAIVGNMMVNSYAVNDFDFAADRYKFQLENDEWRVAYPSEITDNGDGTYSWKGQAIKNLGIAYFTGTLNFTVNAASLGSKNNLTSHKVTFVEENGEWIVYVNGVSTGAKLTNELFDWNHFTVVLAADNSVVDEKMQLKNSQLYIFLDGNCIYKAEASPYGTATQNLFLYQLNIGMTNAQAKTYNWSGAVDNFVTNFYPIGWDSGEAYGIDNYFEDNASKAVSDMASIATCSDVVYNFDKDVNVKFYDDKGNLVSEGTYKFGDELAAITSGTSIVINDKNSASLVGNMLGNWTYDLDGVATPVASIDKDVYEYLVSKSADGTLELAVTATTVGQSVIETYTGGYIMYTIDENGDAVVDVVRTAWDRTVALVDTWNSKTGTTMLFLEDISLFHSSRGYIAVSNGKTLTVDVNGNKLMSSQTSGSDVSGMFNVGKESTLNIKSTTPGAIVSHCVNNSKTNVILSKGMIQFANMEGEITGETALKHSIGNDANVNINGNGITFYTGGIVWGSSGSADYVYDSTPDTVININGGTFNVTYGYQAFTNNDFFNINVENAKFYIGENNLFYNDANRYFKTYATFTNCEIVGTGVMFGRAAAKNSAASYTFTGCTIIGLNAADNFTVGKIYLKGANKVSGSYTGCIIDTSVPVFAPVMNNGVGPVVSYSCQYIDDYVISGGAWTAWEPKTATGTATINIATYASAEDCLADGFTAVNFLKPDGSVYATDYYYPGSTLVTLPEANFPGVVPSGDNWTGTGYGAWANAEVGVTVVTEGMTISPATVTVGYVSGMLADLTLADLVVFNIYIPAYAGEGFEYVGMDTTLKNGSGYAATCATTTIGGKLYYAVSVKVAAYDLAAFTTKINYKIDGVDYSADITFDIFRYVDAVLALEEYACGSEASKLLLNLLQYKREAYVYKFKIVDQKNFVQATLDMIDDYINTKHGDDCKCAADLDTIDIPEWTSAKHGTLEGVVTASQYTLNGGTPTLLIYVNQEIAPNVANVEVRYRRAIQDGEVVYLTDAWSYAEGTITKRNDGYRYDVRGVSMHMQACMAKITITLTDGTIYEGFYSLGEYCNATMTENGWTASEEMYNYCQRVAKALYATSIAAFDYKTSPAN